MYSVWLTVNLNLINVYPQTKLKSTYFDHSRYNGFARELFLEGIHDIVMDIEAWCINFLLICRRF